MTRNASGAAAVDLLQQLIRFDTSNPPGNEGPCIRFLDGDAGRRRSRDADDRQRPAAAEPDRSPSGRRLRTSSSLLRPRGRGSGGRFALGRIRRSRARSPRDVSGGAVRST